MANLPGPPVLGHEPSALAESIWCSPLLPVALTVTAGIVLDHFLVVPFLFSWLAGVAGLIAFLAARLGGGDRLALVYLALAGTALGAAYHHYRRNLSRDDDIAHLASSTPRPVHLEGTLGDEPRRLPARPAEPLRSQPEPASAATVLHVSHLIEAGQKRAVSGRVRLLVQRDPRESDDRPLLEGLHPGDTIAVRGQMVRFAGRANPGEFDLAGYWNDRGVHVLVTARQGNAAVARLRQGWHRSLSGWLGVIRGAAHDRLERTLAGHSTAGLARALLLGEGAPLTQKDWDRFVRTGVVHVLAISGQHLVIIACFLWFAAPRLGVRQRHSAVFVALVLLGYALVTGGRPPALRAAVGTGVVCVGLVIGRPAVPANLLALAWLIVVVVQPSDAFDPGCLLSFLSVIVLCWGATWVLHREPDSLEETVDRSRSVLSHLVHGLLRGIAASYVANLVVWVAITPLVASLYGTVCPAAIVLGPPLTFLASIALFGGFLLLAVGWSSGLAWLPAQIVHLSLAGCEWLVDTALRWPTHLWIGAIPPWWVAGYCVVLLVLLTHAPLRRHWRRFIPAGVAWLAVLLLIPSSPSAPELRCTFLSVGHGGAVVLELPDGRTVLYDVGSMRGPEMVERIVAPFLWSRRIQRLDDVILSHADLDHYNGLVGLAERFAIGRVLTSGTFGDRPIQGVARTLAELRRRRIPHETIQAGDEMSAAGVTFRVLHPPCYFREGNENARSVVLEVRHAGHALLLTGDLEGAGFARLLRLPRRRVDVVMAPHHGSTGVDGAALVRWCRPRLVVSCQGRPRGARAEARYRGAGAEFWTTYAQGAITVRSGALGLIGETFRDGQRWRVRP